ncbi:MAG: AMP-binding protein [bacterium]|nr:AMP-binding protein [bacterium]
MPRLVPYHDGFQVAQRATGFERMNDKKSDRDFADEALEDRAAVDPGGIVLVEGGRSWSSHALATRVALWTSELRRLGIYRGDRVATLLPNSVDSLSASLAILGAGAILVPVNVRTHATDIRHVLAESGAKLLLTRGGEAELAAPCPVHDVSDLETSQAGPQSPCVAAEASHRPSERHPDDLAVLFYTSGSTGRPKGVMITHRALMHGIDSVCKFLPIGPKDRLGAVLPLTFDAGLNTVLAGLHAGATVVLLSYVFPRSLADDLSRHAVTGLVAVPQIYHALARCGSPPLPEMRFCASTGGRMDPGLIDELSTLMPHMRFTVMYGLTEAFRATALDPVDFPTHRGSIGKAIPHAEVRIVREDGTEAPDLEVGEIVQIGPLLGQGYWNAPEATAERYRPAPVAFGPRAGEPAVFSGDLGWRDAEGFLYFAGRKDRLIKSRGLRIAPEQIERALVEHGGTGAVHVAGVEDLALGQRIVAFLEVRDRELPDDATLRARLRPHLASFMMPDDFVRVPEFPLNGNGKPDGRALLKRLEGP